MSDTPTSFPQNNPDQDHPEDTSGVNDQQSAAEVNPPDQQPMEVHHHAHHEGKKNWKSYFWEFLMLFLAVFCGFLAEYKLEHRIEEERAIQLAGSFYQELENDSITASVKVQNRLKQEEAIRYLVAYFRDSSLTNTSRTFAINFQYGLSFRSNVLFEPRTIILDQLRNSGSLRYFRNEEFQRLTGDLTVAIRNVFDRQELETQNRLQYINPLLIAHNDFAFVNTIRKGEKNIFNSFEMYEKSAEVVPFHLNSIEKINRQDLVNLLSFYESSVLSSTREVHIQRYIDINAELLKVLREEFHLK